MNHLGDTNKMVGETPMTDAEECEMFIGVSTFTPEDVQQAFHFARQLERELNAANDRIKRLEEAGDALEYASVILEAGEDPNGFEKLLIAQREWRKAKEAKP